ncbi:MAG TPA: M10 family metallopeptidase C-terminal domain-containing protein, partial [Acetobacteraceae bacterium]|nr:M10 family metallopeptidase C-terminal domain-containing protein [Acetobacteraceae bacterium]
LGDSPTTPVDYIYTDAFATAVGQQRSVLTDDTGLARINTAAVTTGSYLDLHAGATDQIAGRALQIGADTIVRNLWAGDGNDTIVANDAGDTIQAGRGNDTIIAGLGGDTLSGGPGNDTFVFNAQPLSPDVITDFLPGSDVIDLRGLISSSGYTGSDPVADGWLSLQSDGHGGTAFAVGRASNPAVDVASVAPSMLHQGSDYLTVTSVA